MYAFGVCRYSEMIVLELFFVNVSGKDDDGRVSNVVNGVIGAMEQEGPLTVVGEDSDEPCSHLSGIKESGQGEKNRASRCSTYGGTYTDVPSGMKLQRANEYSNIFLRKSAGFTVFRQ